MPFQWICDRTWRRTFSLRSCLFGGLLIYFLVTQAVFLHRQLRDSAWFEGKNYSARTTAQLRWFGVPQTIQGSPAPTKTDSSSKGPKLVIIISYQRTGSTHLGNLFNQNPEAFYSFEPLDGLYVSMYGTAPGYNVPSDITNFWDGASRPMPVWEREAISDSIDALLTCRHIDALPTEMLLHDFWNGYKYDHINIKAFLQCLQDSRATSFTALCRAEARRIQSTCGQWFGQRRKGLEVCPRNLWPAANRTRVDRTFADYVRCINRQRSTVDKCVPLMEGVCRNSRIRATKVVRPTMQSVPKLMEKYSENLKILHLFRRPQSVVKSRQKFSSVRGHSSTGSVVKEARTYCMEAVKDIKLRKTLQEKYPNSFKQIIYEEFIANQNESIKDVYEFLEEPMPTLVMNYFTNRIFTPDRKSGWLASETGGKTSDDIDRECQEFYKELDYKWDVLL